MLFLMCPVIKGNKKQEQANAGRVKKDPGLPEYLHILPILNGCLKIISIYHFIEYHLKVQHLSVP